MTVLPGVLIVGLHMEVCSNKPLSRCTRLMLLCSKRVNILRTNDPPQQVRRQRQPSHRSVAGRLLLLDRWGDQNSRCCHQQSPRGRAPFFQPSPTLQRCCAGGAYRHCYRSQKTSAQAFHWWSHHLPPLHQHCCLQSKDSGCKLASPTQVAGTSFWPRIVRSGWSRRWRLAKQCISMCSCK